MLAHRCGEYEWTKNIYEYQIAEIANEFWEENASTEEDKIKIEEFEKNS